MAQAKKPGGRGWKQGIDPKFIGRRIVERREIVRLTQEQLAKKVQRAQSNVAAYETGASVPNLAALRDLAVALETSVDFLIGVDTVRAKPRVGQDTPQPPSGIVESRPPVKISPGR
jgi:transcriptional regulator with XRE-family HTH domain